MRNLFQLSFGILCIIIFILSGCKSDDGPTAPEEQVVPEHGVTMISSSERGRVETESGYALDVIAGTVPLNREGGVANISFSIEVDVEPPVQLPSAATLIGKIVQFGPQGFAFNWPVQMILPFPEGTDLSTLMILQYDSEKELWKAIPISYIDDSNNFIVADVLKLSYNAVVSVSSGLGKTEDNECTWGGFRMENPEQNMYYTLTVRSVSQFKCEWQEEWFADELVGSTGCTGHHWIGGPLPFTSILLAQASYEIWITKTTGETPYQIFTYSVPAEGTVEGHVTYGTPTPFGIGWTPLSFPSGGTWVEGPPDDWPMPTVTFGTGLFQATLAWTNNNWRQTDLDLHVYGPNGMHVYWLDDISSDNSIELDRDFMDDPGNAIENIYSIGDMPSGEYRVVVKKFLGDDTNFNVRVLRPGSVRTYSKKFDSSTGDELIIEVFTL